MGKMMSKIMIVALAIVGYFVATNVYADSVQYSVTFENATGEEGNRKEIVADNVNLENYINEKKTAFKTLAAKYNAESQVDDTLFSTDYFYSYAEAKESDVVVGTPANGVTPVTIKYKTVSVNKLVKSVNVKVVLPKVGSEITKKTVKETSGEYEYTIDKYLPEATATITSGANVKISGQARILNDDKKTNFTGTLENGKKYYVAISLYTENGAIFADDATVTFNNSSTYEQGKSFMESYREYIIQLEAPTATETASTAVADATEESNVVDESVSTYQVLDGEKQTFNVNTEEGNLTFRFAINFNEFQASGNVYMDGSLVAPSNYTIKKGSTYIIFNKEYADKLASGNHTIKVTTANGEVSTSFKITRVNNPNTADGIMSYIILLAISLSGLTGTIIYSRKNKIAVCN